MTLRGFVCVLLGRVERPVFVREREFDVQCRIFSQPLRSVGDIERRIGDYCNAHVLLGDFNQDQIISLATSYLFDKQEDHSLTKIELLELQKLSHSDQLYQPKTSL